MSVVSYTKAKIDALLGGKQDAGDYATNTALTAGLGGKVNSSTYTAGLASKADQPTGGTDGQALVKAGSTTAWATVAGGTTPDATSTVKGAVQLAGDLGGTAAAPTVPGLAGKLTASSNLSDVANAATARTNLGLGSAATSAATAFDASGAAAAAQAAAVQRANHTGTQSADTLTDGTTNKAFLATERTKLSGVATGATANATDAALRDRSTHTGTQAASTVTGLSAVATSGAYADLSGQPTIPAAYTDAQAQAANATALAAKANTADIGVPQLAPSGGDDGPAIAAQVATYGVARLGPGVFKVNTPQILRAKTQYRSGTNAYAGLALVGAGADLTTLDTSGAGVTSHDLATVTAITVGATTTGTLSAAVNWVDGSQVVISLPSYRRGIDSGSTIDLLNGQVVFVKATNRVGGTFTTFQLYCDAALTVPLISTGWGTFATPAFMRRYSSDRTVLPSAVLRVTGPATGHPDIYNVAVSDLTLRNTTTQAISYDRQGVAVAIESDRTDRDTIVAQNISFDRVRFEGYDCAVLLDDCTNTRFDSCDFHGNSYYVWCAFNVDIVKFTNCMLGEDFPVQGQPLPQVIAPALSYYAPINPTQDYAGSRNAYVFDNCWFMGVRAITGGAQVRTYGGAQVYWTNGVNPKPLTLTGCYFEQVSWLADGQAIRVTGCHFGNFSRDANLTNGRAVFNLMTDNYDGARITVENCTADPAIGAGPQIGYISAANWGSSGGQANEETTPSILWRGNDLPAGAGGAHIVDFLDPTRKILLDDGAASGNQAKGGGDYVFEGMLQAGGRVRTTRTATAFTGTVTPDVLAATRYWIGAMTGAVTVANPTVGGTATFSSLFAASGTSAASFPMNNPLRVLPLEFVFEQDATGGRTVTFGTDFDTTRLVLKGTAGQKTIIRFAWNGTKWIPLGPNMWTPGAVSPDPLIGSGNPQGQVNAPVGTLFLRTDGFVGSTLYVKETGTGSTGWTSLSAPGILVSYNQAGAYTLGSVDYGLGMDMTSATAVILTVPTNAAAGLPVGSLVRVTQAGAGQVTVAAATPGTTTIRTPMGMSTRAQWSTIELRKRATDEWVLSGDLSAT